MDDPNVWFATVFLLILAVLFYLEFIADYAGYGTVIILFYPAWDGLGWILSMQEIPWNRI